MCVREEDGGERRLFQGEGVLRYTVRKVSLSVYSPLLSFLDIFRPLKCGFHRCDRMCHSDDCGPCKNPCGKPRKLWYVGNRITNRSPPHFIPVVIPLSTPVRICAMRQVPARRQNPVPQRLSSPVHADEFVNPSSAVANPRIPLVAREARPLHAQTSARSRRGTPDWRKHWGSRPTGLIGTKRRIVTSSLRSLERTPNLFQSLRRAWLSKLSKPTSLPVGVG